MQIADTSGRSGRYTLQTLTDDTSTIYGAYQCSDSAYIRIWLLVCGNILPASLYLRRPDSSNGWIFQCVECWQILSLDRSHTKNRTLLLRLKEVHFKRKLTRNEPLGLLAGARFPPNSAQGFTIFIHLWFCGFSVLLELEFLLFKPIYSAMKNWWNLRGFDSTQFSNIFYCYILDKNGISRIETKQKYLNLILY